MDESNIPDEFNLIVLPIKNKIGKMTLNNDELTIIVADEIVHSFTRDEKITEKCEL